MKRSITTSRGSITLREAALEDAMPFRALRLEALQDSPTAFTADYARTLDHPPKYWEDRLKMQADESTILFAEHGARLIGMTGIARGNSPKTRHSAWIWGVYVTPAWRGLRIAGELISSCFAWAIARKIVILKLGVSSINQAAIRCYARCGFAVYGTEPRAIFYDGQYYEEFLMARPLDPTAYTMEQ